MDLLIPDSGLLFWMTLVFIIVFIILWKAGFPACATAASTTQNLRTLLWDFFLHCCSKFCMVILFPAFRSLLYGGI